MKRVERRTDRKSTTTFQLRIGSFLSLLIGIVGAIVAYFEAGALGFLVSIPLWLFAMLGSILGVVPFFGPVLYYFGVKALFDFVSGTAGTNMPWASGLLFWSNLVFSILYCIMTSVVLVAVRLRRRE